MSSPEDPQPGSDSQRATAPDATEEPGLRRDFKVFYDRHESAVYALMRRWFSHETAQDVTHDTFLAAYEQWPTICTCIEDPDAYIFGMAKNQRIDRHLKNQKLGIQDSAQQIDPTADSASADGGHGATEDRIVLGRAIDSLPPRQRDTIKLYYHEDWPTRQIAEFQGVTIGSVSRTLSYARSALRKLLEQDESLRVIEGAENE